MFYFWNCQSEIAFSFQEGFTQLLLSLAKYLSQSWGPFLSSQSFSVLKEVTLPRLLTLIESVSTICV